MEKEKSYLSTLLFFARNYRYLFILLIFLAVSIGFIESLTISLMYPIISSGLGMDADAIPYIKFISWFFEYIPGVNPFEQLIVLFLLTTILALFGQIIYWKLAYIFTKNVVLFVKRRIYQQVRLNDYHFFEERKQGDIINLLNAGPNRINSSLETLMSIIVDCAITIMIITSLYFISPIGLVVVIAGGIFYYFINSLVAKNISKRLGQRSYQSGLSENVIITEYISGIRAIRASNAMKHWEDQAMKAVRLYWDLYPSGRFIQNLPGILLYSSFLLCIGFVVLILSWSFEDNFSAIIPIFGAFAIGTFRIIPKISSIGKLHLTLINNMHYVQSVYHFIKDESYHTITNGEKIFTGIKELVCFDNVNFSYGHSNVLNNLTFSLMPGKMTAIVGSSGAGKSTITSLLLRLYDPTGGRILLNSVDLREYDIGSVLDHIGYVGQEPFVFNASIRDNITFGEEFSDNDIEYATKLAHAHHFILNLPDGYDTIIGDRGMKLSGGEKQRIVIARAIIRGPDLLILDEATSSLDNISELLVQEAIDEVTKECTTLVIAHRLTTIQNADHIYVIDKGSVVEEGTHDQLLEMRGAYWDMYMRMRNNETALLS